MKNRMFYLASFFIVMVLILTDCNPLTKAPTDDDGSAAPTTQASATEPPMTQPDTAQPDNAPPDSSDPANATQPPDNAPDDTDPPDATEPPDATQPDTTDENTIVMARATWDTGWFQAELFRQLLERMGYTVPTPQDMEVEEFYNSLAQGTVDLWVNGWFPLHNSNLESEDMQEKVHVIGSEVRGGALQGYLVDKQSADDLDITNLEDFKQPAIADMFDWDGNGKADLIGCNADWGCAAVIEHHLDTYELRDTIEHRQGDYNELFTELIERFENGEPVLFYTWTPNWTLGKLIPGKDVVWLEVPFSSLPADQKDKEELTIIENVSGCVGNPCNMGFPPNDIRVAANAEFLEEHIQVKRLLELVEIPLLDIGIQNSSMFDGESSPEDIARQAQEWIADNQEQVDAWVSEAQTYTGAKMLQRVKERGKVLCGVDGTLQGFSYRESDGSYSGFNADFCRVIATAVFGTPDAVEFVPLTEKRRFQAVSDKKVDVLFYNTTWIAMRDVGMDPPNSGIRLDFGPTIFHDGQRFMVHADRGIAQMADLEGKTICTLQDSDAAQNMSGQLAARNIMVQTAAFEDTETVYATYDQGVCDAVTGNTSELVARRLALSNPDAHVILGDQISREPQGPVFVEDESEWADVVSWAIHATIYAEELDVDSTNVDSLQTSPNPDIQYLLGQKGRIGEKLGLEDDFALNIIRQVGSYGEIYNRNLGPDTALKLDRGPNKAWNKGVGGVLSSPPFR